MTDRLPDPETPFGKKVRAGLADEIIIWLTTTGADGTPQPNPVWFLADGDTVLVYNQTNAFRLAHVKQRPRVALNLNSETGGDVVILLGEAEIVDDVLAPHENPAYVAKYQAHMERVAGSAENFTARYPVPMRIKITSVRGH